MNDRAGAYEIPSWALARHFAHVRPVLLKGAIDHGLVRVVNAECSVCHQPYSRCIEPEFARLLLRGQGQCNACYEAQEPARDMEDEP